MGLQILFFGAIVAFFSVPIYWGCKLIQCIFNKGDEILNNEKGILNKKWIESAYRFIVISICILGLIFNFNLVKTGESLKQYNTGQYLDFYTSLSFDHILTIIVFFVLGVIAYYIIKGFSERLAPIPYVICCSILIINIIFTIVYFLHTSGVNLYNASSGAEVMWMIKLGFIYLSIMYIIQLKNSMDIVIAKEKKLNKVYKNKLINKMYILVINYQSNPVLWIITLIPVLIIIQLILVIFGQKPDSFIQVFFETSSYNYSKVIPPDPIIIQYDGHYLCTVSARGHEKVVKPLRAGIRHGNRILVNRQLLVANAFENILEQYTPRFHKGIRYIYDKYGYPLSKHINTKFSADLIYILMKPLELIFLIVLYSVDNNPENRISIQYSELRK